MPRSEGASQKKEEAVDLGDAIGIKRKLDEAAIKVLQRYRRSTLMMQQHIDR